MVTSDEYAEFDRACRRIRRENEALLKEFNAWMRAQGLSESTVGMHFFSASFYIQEFLLYEQPLRAREGAFHIGMYLGYWFIRKGPIATPGTVKTHSTGLIKFYTFLVERGLVAAEELDRMRKTVKRELPRWQERARRYNDPAIDDPSQIWI